MQPEPDAKADGDCAAYGAATLIFQGRVEPVATAARVRATLPNRVLLRMRRLRASFFDRVRSFFAGYVAGG